MAYIAIIGDIVDSQTLTDRSQVQNQLQKVLKYINNKYKAHISANFAITLGDEFQGLLKRPDFILHIIQEIEFAVYPVEIRFGIGMGEVTTAIQRNKSREIDGPAYHRARRMMEEIKDGSTRYEKVERNIMFASASEDNPSDSLVNATLSISYVVKKSWTAKQVKTIQAYLTADKNQYRTSEILDVGQPTVSRSLLSSKYYAFEQAMLSIQKYINAEFSKHTNPE